MNNGGWQVAGTGGRFWNGEYWKAPSGIQDSANDYKSQGDNSSPLGRVIVTGVGTVMHHGEIIVDPKHLGGYRQSNGRTLVNIVLCILDTQLSGTFELIWARANKQFIIRNEAPLRSMNTPYRFYGGDQTAVDPVITQYLPAEDRTAWPGLVYVVFENFDIAPYENKVPVFDFHVASSVTSQATTEEQSALTFGVGEGSYEYTPSTVDPLKGQHYQINGISNNNGTISVIDIASNTEISRATIHADTGWRFVEHPVALDGSDLIACTVFDPIYELALLNVLTGEIIARLPVIYDSFDQPYEPAPKCAVLLESGTATKYLIFCSYVYIGFNDAHGSFQGVALADATNGTLEWVSHPYINPLVGETHPYSIAVGPVSDGQCTVWWTDENGGVVSINEAVINSAGHTSRVLYTSAELNSDYPGIAWNPTNDTLLAYLSDGRFRKIDRDGTVLETFPGSIANMNINNGASPDLFGLTSSMRPGYAAALRGVDDIYLINLADGSLIKLTEGDDVDWSYAYWFYDQYSGVITVSSGEPNRMWKITLGNATPDQVDLEDIYAAISSFEGRKQ